MSDKLSSTGIGEQHKELLSARTIDEQQVELIPARNTMDAGAGGLAGIIQMITKLTSDRNLKSDITLVEWSR